MVIEGGFAADPAERSGLCGLAMEALAQGRLDAGRGRADKARGKPAARGRYGGSRGSGNSTVWLLPAVVAAIALLVVIRLVGGGRGPALGTSGQPASPAVVRALTTIPASVFDRAGLADATLPFGGLAEVWRASDGRPVLLYIGADYCPYCAATRWALIAALARFGTWSGLRYMTSSSTDVFPNTPTFTFVHAHLKSPYVDFQGVEVQGALGVPLQKPNALQQAALKKLDGVPYVTTNPNFAGSIPFLDVGDRYLWSGAPYSPGLLSGLTWAQAARLIASGKGPLAQAVLANANSFSATICALDGQRPAAVCDAAPIRGLESRLPGPQHGNGPVGGGLVALPSPTPSAHSTATGATSHRASVLTRGHGTPAGGGKG